MKHSRTMPSRRGFVLGATAVGAAAAAVVGLPQVETAPAAVIPLQPAPEKGGGYRLTEHVKQYYKSTLI